MAALCIFVAACSRNASFQYLVPELLLNTAAMFWVLRDLCFWTRKQKTAWFSENSNHQIPEVLQYARSFSSSQLWCILLFSNNFRLASSFKNALNSFNVCSYRSYGGWLTPFVLLGQTSHHLVLPLPLQILACWLLPSFVSQARAVSSDKHLLHWHSSLYSEMYFRKKQGVLWTV